MIGVCPSYQLIIRNGSTGMLKGGGPFVRSQPLDIDGELMSVNVGGKVLTKECDTRLTAHGTWATLSAEWGGLQDSSSWVSVPGNLQRIREEAFGFTEFSYNIQREKDGNCTTKPAIDNYLGSSWLRQSPCRLP